VAKTESGTQQPFWQRTLASLETDLRTDGTGLDVAEAARRSAVYGPNVLRPRREWGVVLQFLSRFGNPLIVLPLAAATSSAFTGDVASSRRGACQWQEEMRRSRVHRDVGCEREALRSIRVCSTGDVCAGRDGPGPRKWE